MCDGERVIHDDVPVIIFMNSEGGDLSECVRVHLPVGYVRVSRNEKKERGKKCEKYFCGKGEWKGREGSEGDDTRRVCHGRQHSVPPTGPSNKHPKRWTPDDVCAWVTGWGSGFMTVAGTQLQNGVRLRFLYKV